MSYFAWGYLFLFIIYFCRLFLTTLNYFRAHYALEFYEENDPDIYFYGLNSFDFINSNLDFEGKYLYLNSSNLGTTGKVSHDCYEGKCYYYDYEESSLDTHHHINCSTYCRINKKSGCNPNDCEVFTLHSQYRDNECVKGELEVEEDEDKNVSKDKQSCYLDNMILYWKGLYYKRENFTISRYSYMVISDNETCPYEYNSCGMLDDLGHRLCVAGFVCPINFITTNIEEINKTYEYFTVNLTDNKKIYYTNEAREKGRIVQGLYVDTDLALQYTDGCEILDTENITDLFNDHKNRLYKDILSYDPYKDENINLKGKSYLKWCSPGFGQNKDITRIKEINDELYRNQTENDIICGVKRVYDNLFFFELGAHIILIIIFITSLISTFEEEGSDICGCSINSKCECTATGCLIGLFILNIPGFVIFCVLISRFNDLKYSSKNICYGTIIVFKIIDVINIVLSLIFFIAIVVIGQKL